MNDTVPTVTATLTDRALQRLRRLADGNGVAADAITLLESQEKTYVLTGISSLTPKSETRSARYPGPVRGKGRQIMASIAAMQQEAQTRLQQFQNDKGWVAKARHELAAAPGFGWGLDDATITFPDQSVVLAASSACPTCQGQKLVTCPQCQGQGALPCPQCRGQRQEICYNCGGRGENPGQPGQPCSICHGQRMTTCRQCQGQGQLTCPQCQGRRGTPCLTCNGSGLITEEITVSCTVTTHFKLIVEDLPSGLRRGLDRLGVANLVKGHADIGFADAPVEEKPDEEPQVWESLSKEDFAAEAPKPANPEIHYQAQLPYADLRIRFGQGRVTMVSVFGKKAALLGVPPFLDDALQPALAALRQVASGTGNPDAALKPRLMREALALALVGKLDVKAMRRHYPYGISNEKLQEISRQMGLALRRLTHNARAVTAAGLVLAAGVIFALLWISGIAVVTRTWAPATQLSTALFVLAGFVGAAWLALGLATRAVLRRRFPELPIALTQNNGAIGYIMLAAMTALFVALLAVSRV